MQTKSFNKYKLGRNDQPIPQTWFHHRILPGAVPTPGWYNVNWGSPLLAVDLMKREMRKTFV